MPIIDNDIPIPSHIGRGKPKTLPFYDMEVGQSVLLENRKRDGLANTLKRLRDNRGWKFCTRSEGSGTRIWRIE